MAASNAHFWIGNDWDSNEGMMMRSRRFCTRVPRCPYIEPLSGSAAKMLVVTLQGVQALYAVAASAQSYLYSVDIYLGNVFLPLAIFGLLRLPTAAWMWDDSAYANEDRMLVPSLAQAASSEHDTGKSTPEDQKVADAARFAPTMRLPVEPQDDPSTVRFRPSNSLRGIAVRAFYLLSLLALLSFAAYSAFPGPKPTTPQPTTPQPPVTVSANNYTHIIFFLFFLLTTFCIICFYFLRGDSTMTIIPCLRSIWYRLYTAVLFLGMLLLIIFAAIESRGQWCGQWTTYSNNPTCPK
jgi:hypothetical protein